MMETNSPCVDVEGDAAQDEHLAPALVVGAVHVAESDERFVHGWAFTPRARLHVAAHSARRATDGSTRAARRAGT